MPRSPRVLAALLALAQLALAAPAAADPVGDHEASWLHETLAFQYRLGSTLPLRNAPWIGTHNSYNTTTEPDTLSGQDPNQSVNLLDQLRLDARSLELDAHYVASAERLGRRTVVLCHGRGSSEAHAGCSTERPMAERLGEVREFLDAHPSEVVLLYVEDHLDSRAGYEEAAEILSGAFGDDLYRPADAGGARDGACVPMPLDLTRRRMQAQSKQVLVISGCGPAGTGWRGVAFDDAEREAHESQPDGFEPYPACDPERGPEVYEQHFVRVYEDSTRLSSSVGGTRGRPPVRITPRLARELARCGVDLLGFDHLVPGDPRLEALVWSWAEGHPRARPGGTCAFARVQDGRWRTASCIRRRTFACRHPGTGRWAIDKRRGPHRAGDRRRCPGAFKFTVPRTAQDAARLQDAMRVAGVRTAWLRHRR